MTIGIRNKRLKYGAFALGVGFAVLAAFALYVGFNIFVGWVAFLVYREVAPASWIDIGLWPWVGITFLAGFVLRHFSR